MPRNVYTMADLKREQRISLERHERLRSERLRSIIYSIERAMDGGAEEVSAVLQSLTHSERSDLYDHFPKFLASLQGASSLEEMMAVTRGVNALRSRSAQSSARSASESNLARHALVFAKAPHARRTEVVADLALVESPPETLFGVIALWVRIHLKVLVRRVWRRT